MPLPTFIIGGERRGGTTALYYWMKTHPSIYFYPQADMDYFIEKEIAATRVWRDGKADAEQWERTHSVAGYSEMFNGAEGFPTIGQKDADLLFWRPAHARLARFLPNTRFIFTLRDPVKRAWSHYCNELGKGREDLAFGDALAAEDERIARSDYARLHLSYRRRGSYSESLRAFYDHVDPSRVLVLILEECLAEPLAALQEVYAFIGVSPTLGLENAGRKFNENPVTFPKPWARSPGIASLERVYSRVSDGIIRRIAQDRETRTRMRLRAQSIFRLPASTLQIPESVRNDLAGHFAPDIDKLEGLLGRRLPWKR